jgi:hypothetical protein
LVVPNFVRIDGYFAHITDESDTIFFKTDDGTNAFSYPLDNDIQNSVVSLEYDGKYLWTLENPTGDDIIFKKWELSGYVGRLQRSYYLVGTTNRKFDSNAFAITHFHRDFADATGSGTVYIPVDDLSRVSPGDIVRLGPSSHAFSAGLEEEVQAIGTVVNSSGTFIQVNAPITHAYDEGDNISWAEDCYFFNKFQPSDPDPTNGSGQLFSFNIHAVTTVLENRNPTAGAHNEFRDVRAATYLTVPSGVPTGPRDYLAYMSQSNLLFLETDTSDPRFLENILSAAQNNQEVDSTIIPVVEITHEGLTLFRLQEKATIRDGATIETQEWDQYNYQLSTLEPLPASISLTATPAIIPADGVSESRIDALVRDQYNSPRGGITVDFTDDDAGGTGGEIETPKTTDPYTGIATTYYEAGEDPKLVTITAETTISGSP